MIRWMNLWIIQFHGVMKQVAKQKMKCWRWEYRVCHHSLINWICLTWFLLVVIVIDGDNNIKTEQLGKIRDDKPIKQDAEYTKRSPELGIDRNLGDFNSKKCPSDPAKRWNQMRLLNLRTETTAAMISSSYVESWILSLNDFIAILMAIESSAFQRLTWSSTFTKNVDWCHVTKSVLAHCFGYSFLQQIKKGSRILPWYDNENIKVFLVS